MSASSVNRTMPGLAPGPGVLHLQGLQHLDQAAQGGHRGQPDSGSWLLVAAATWVTSLGVASPMMSNCIDPLGTSIAVDSLAGRLVTRSGQPARCSTRSA